MLDSERGNRRHEETAMKALVVYESMFGNTEAIAIAIRDGLAARMEAELVEVSRAPSTLPHDVSLLVAGGPTHAFGLSRDATRQDAAQKSTEPVVSAGQGLREWFAGLDVGSTGSAAAFDTHIDKRVPGSAAKAAAKRLRRLGLRVIVPAESFYVTDSPGPLLDGETERARQWGEDVATTFVAQLGGQPVT
jgi:flavodoxin